MGESKVLHFDRDNGTDRLLLDSPALREKGQLFNQFEGENSFDSSLNEHVPCWQRVRIPEWVPGCSRRRIIFFFFLSLLIALMGALYGASKNQTPSSKCEQCKIIGTRESNIAQGISLQEFSGRALSVREYLLK